MYVHLAAGTGEPVDQPWVGVQAILPSRAAAWRRGERDRRGGGGRDPPDARVPRRDGPRRTSCLLRPARVVTFSSSLGRLRYDIESSVGLPLPPERSSVAVKRSSLRSGERPAHRGSWLFTSSHPEEV